MKILPITLITFFATFSVACAQVPTATPALESATVLEFADPTTLFVADSEGGAVYAFTLPKEEAATTSAAFNFKGFILAANCLNKF